MIEKYKYMNLDLQQSNSDLIALENKIKEQKKILEDVKRNRLHLFKQGIVPLPLKSIFVGFELISAKVKEMYRLITGGGDAELEPVDHLDPFSEGISYQVRPLKKSWKQMNKLSGGEKTISSLAFIFAFIMEGIMLTAFV